MLTQSAVEAAEAVTRNAGIRDAFDLVLSAPELGAFKPDDLAYKSALERAGANDAWFVAGHWWDIAGAAYAGLRTAWVSRTDLAYPVAMPDPDVSGADWPGRNGAAGYSSAKALECLAALRVQPATRRANSLSASSPWRSTIACTSASTREAAYASRETAGE